MIKPATDETNQESGLCDEGMSWSEDRDLVGDVMRRHKSLTVRVRHLPNPRRFFLVVFRDQPTQSVSSDQFNFEMLMMCGYLLR
jgi:hypothetical protein